MKIYLCLSGMWDDKVDLITTNLKEAYDYCDSTTRLIDLREYEIDIHSFRRPDRKEIKHFWTLQERFKKH